MVIALASLSGLSSIVGFFAAGFATGYTASSVGGLTAALGFAVSLLGLVAAALVLSGLSSSSVGFVGGLPGGFAAGFAGGFAASFVGGFTAGFMVGFTAGLLGGLTTTLDFAVSLLGLVAAMLVLSGSSSSSVSSFLGLGLGCLVVSYSLWV